MKSRPKPWICESVRKERPCGEAEFFCPACEKIYCWTCFQSHKEAGCKIYTGTDQCLCIWEPGKKWPACLHDCRGAEGAPGPVGIPKEGKP